MKFTRTILSSFISRATPLARPLAMATFAVLFSTLTMAQYVWLDATGRKVFSDQPPPNNIPAKRVLQDPGKLSSTSSSSAAAAANDDPATKTDQSIDSNDPKAQAKAAAKEAAGKASEAVKKSAAKDKDLETAKKKADDEVAAKKKAEDDARNVARVDNCVRAKQAKATLDSGVRLNQYNAKGESVFMDEAARTVETKRLEGILTADCK